jgi:hypothetical protein
MTALVLALVSIIAGFCLIIPGGFLDRRHYSSCHTGLAGRYQSSVARWYYSTVLMTVVLERAETPGPRHDEAMWTVCGGSDVQALCSSQRLSYLSEPLQ